MCGVNAKGIWSFTYTLTQSTYNLRLLYFIENKLGIKGVSVPNSKDECAQYRIRDYKVLIDKILPIFDKYLLLTSKCYKYLILSFQTKKTYFTVVTTKKSSRSAINNIARAATNFIARSEKYYDWYDSGGIQNMVCIFNR